MKKYTPGPWKANFSNDTEWHGVEDTYIEHEGGLIGKVYGTEEFPCVEATDEICEELATNARLVASAPDHAAIARVLVSGKARWEASTSEFCIGGMRYSTKLDEFGVPEMTSGIRTAIVQTN